MNLKLKMFLRIVVVIILATLALKIGHPKVCIVLLSLCYGIGALAAIKQGKLDKKSTNDIYLDFVDQTYRNIGMWACLCGIVDVVDYAVKFIANAAGF